MIDGNSRFVGILAAAVAMSGVSLGRRGPPPFERFGAAGEFSAEEIVKEDDNGKFLSRVWRLHQDGPHVARDFKRRGQCFEAAADVARARGDSVEVCAKLIGGVRW